MAYQVQEILGAPGVDKEMRMEKYSRDLLTMIHGPSTYAGLVRGAPDWQIEAKDAEVTEV